jgi:hypothetical protein
MSEPLGLGDRDRRRGTIYPSPFFDIAQTYMPPTVKELFRWCKYFFYKDPVIGAVVTKIAEYPVTDFVYNADSTSTSAIRGRGSSRTRSTSSPSSSRSDSTSSPTATRFVSINCPSRAG